MHTHTSADLEKREDNEADPECGPKSHRDQSSGVAGSGLQVDSGQPVQGPQACRGRVTQGGQGRSVFDTGLPMMAALPILNMTRATEKAVFPLSRLRYFLASPMSCSGGEPLNLSQVASHHTLPHSHTTLSSHHHPSLSHHPSPHNTIPPLPSQHHLPIHTTTPPLTSPPLPSH